MPLAYCSYKIIEFGLSFLAIAPTAQKVGTFAPSKAKQASCRATAHHMLNRSQIIDNEIDRMDARTRTLAEIRAHISAWNAMSHSQRNRLLRTALPVEAAAFVRIRMRWRACQH